MNSRAPESQCFAFSFPSLDMLVEVEASPAGVLIHASRPAFSEARKACFIRELAAEGFIDDGFRWHPPDGPGDVRWVVNTSRFMPDAACTARARRFALRLFCSAAALWVLLMAGVLLHPAGQPARTAAGFIHAARWP
jgi:hypothetical protein